MSISSAVKRAINFRRRKAPKTPSGLPVSAGELPEDPKRMGLCRLAFEAGLDELALNDEFVDELLSLQDTVTVGVLWKALAPLTRAERGAVVWRVREFAKARKETGQNS